MKVIVKARHMTLTEALKAHAEDKLSNAVMRIFDRPAAKLEIELGEIGAMRDGKNKECRVSVFIPKSKTINIVEIDEDMYKAIDLAHDRLLLQVKRERGKKRAATRQRKTPAKARALTARNNLTGEREVWEDEVRRYERSTARA
ncbi:MAG: HPF/RaiA family ribosome-associated protein [Deltaproteobacteria bacterium]|nr:HPF/RaiA family ribosome-associated protein [Deltaproteobacteria bacterium]